MDHQDSSSDQNPQEPSLQPVNGDLPYREAVESWALPAAQLRGEDRLANFDLKAITHVVLQVSDARQQQVFSRIGIKHDYNYPYPFWYFLGKIIAKALFEEERLFEILSFVRVRDREFVGYIRKDLANKDDQPKPNVVEVDIKRPQPNEPLQIFWKPARGLIVQKIEEWMQNPQPIR
ncbi:hypothetical protein ACJ41O_006783 [Fusarium nematophilum]